jgi:uridine kinase
VRFILVSGPSSAGKTTFSKRLTTQLRVNGLSPVTLSTDDYFVTPDRNPVDAAGKPDYEHLDAIDLELFNRQLLELVEGREVALPSFDFAARERRFRGRTLRIGPDVMVIIEGLHALNPALTRMVPDDRKFRVYVSALTQLNVDSANRISTTDNRLMRRIVRDRKYRGYSALQTLRQWPSVREGEKRWVFPFQRDADATFNSALDYELAVLKPHVEPLLMQVKPSEPEYAEARRLTEFLLNFLGTPDRPVPPTSILREYIGGSMFHY